MPLIQRVVRICGALAVFSALATGSLFASDWKVLPGHVPHPASALTPIGEVPAATQMRLAIGVPLRDAAGLDQFLAELYDATSTNYHHYLTPEEFTARFGPTEQDYEAVKQFARANGLTITETHGNRLVLDVMGPASAVEKALNLKLQTYQHPTENRQFYAPDTEPVVAADLPVADVQGLSSYARPHPHSKKANGTVSPKNGSASDGAYIGDDFRKAYVPGTTLTGAGQMVGLLQFDGYYASDIAAYAAVAGGGRANITIQNILLDGFDGTPTTGPDSGSSEVSLDIEMAMAMAPGLSKIMVFEAGTDGNQNDILNSMVSYSSVKNLSCSWGWGGGPATTTDAIFKEMAAQGQSFFNATGDSDAFTVGVNSANSVDDINNYNAPSSSPYITQVGGTTLTMSGTAAAFASETVWNWGGGEGSSGGVSSYYSIPTWQSGISMTSNHGSTTQRNIPDVAMAADNVETYYDSGSVDAFGGTSCAAPLWAGFMALVNQQVASSGGTPPGLINAAVYAIGKGQNSSYSYSACFHDTASGNNYWSSSTANYAAVTGYDLCTGWGTPNGVKLISALAGTTSSVSSAIGKLSVSPSAGVAFTGLAGGPFTPASAVLTLTNLATNSLSWSLVSTSAWLTVDSKSGTLAANAAATANVSLAPAAKALKIGSYSSTLVFTNLGAAVRQVVPVTLVLTQAVSISPAQGFTSVGAVGGAFNTNSEVFVLTNASASALGWSLVKTSAWLSVSATNGSLSAGGQTALTVSLSATAKTLKAAIYTSNLRFTNSAGLIAVVPFTLSVGQPLLANGGFETGSFSGWTRSGNTNRTVVVSGSASYVQAGTYGAKLGAAGTPGYLSQPVAATSGQTYKLSLWLRNATGTTPNWFQIRWNGSAVCTLSNLTKTTWTNLVCNVTAAGSSSTLQLGFQDNSNYLGLDDLSLTIVTSTTTTRSILAASVSNLSGASHVAVASAGEVKSNLVLAPANPAADFKYVWNTTPGTVYQVQYKTNLSQPDWINWGSPFTAGAATETMTDTNAYQLSPQRFYRLMGVFP